MLLPAVNAVAAPGCQDLQPEGGEPRARVVLLTYLLTFFFLPVPFPYFPPPSLPNLCFMGKSGLFSRRYAPLPLARPPAPGPSFMRAA